MIMLENNIFVAFESHWASAVPEKRLFVGTPHVEPTQGWQRKCKKKRKKEKKAILKLLQDGYFLLLNSISMQIKTLEFLYDALRE